MKICSASLHDVIMQTSQIQPDARATKCCSASVQSDSKRTAHALSAHIQTNPKSVGQRKAIGEFGWCQENLNNMSMQNNKERFGRWLRYAPYNI